MELLQDFLDIFLHLDKHLSSIIGAYGTWTYFILFAIVFCETGLVITPFLPGDSLLFAAGALAATGSFKPYRMHEMWYSKKYDNAPMPHSVFFHGGYAVHATPHVKMLGRPASHGCIRLHPTHAEDFFRLVQTFGPNNTRIVIVK